MKTMPEKTILTNGCITVKMDAQRRAVHPSKSNDGRLAPHILTFEARNLLFGALHCLQNNTRHIGWSRLLRHMAGGKQGNVSADLTSHHVLQFR